MIIWHAIQLTVAIAFGVAILLLLAAFAIGLLLLPIWLPIWAFMAIS